jgi:hypothetical protein
MIFGF